VLATVGPGTGPLDLSAGLSAIAEDSSDGVLTVLNNVAGKLYALAPAAASQSITWAQQP
jgi:hypothetical protein